MSGIKLESLTGRRGNYSLSYQCVQQGHLLSLKCIISSYAFNISSGKANHLTHETFFLTDSF